MQPKPKTIIRQTESRNGIRFLYRDENCELKDIIFAIEARGSRFVIAVKEYNGGAGGIILGYVNDKSTMTPSARMITNWYIANYHRSQYIKNLFSGYSTLEIKPA